jgi:cellulose synthase/poly-beta-1,6-N-acetylglucosamine synthase-like glycosyltransferase
MNAPTRPEAWARRPLALRGSAAPVALLKRSQAPMQSAAPRAGAGRTAEARAAALAERHGLGRADLARTPPDPALLDPRDVPVYLRHGLLPWRRVGRVTTYASADPADLARGIARLHARPGLACAAVATRAEIEEALATALPGPLAERAAMRTPASLSVRGIAGLRRGAVLGLAALLAMIAAGGTAGLAAALVLLFALNAATTLLRIGALAAGRARPDRAGPAPEGAARLADRRAPPMVSLLVPLYREGEMVPRILAALDRLDYPRDRLEVRLLLEADDAGTRGALEAMELPDWAIPMVVPPGRPRTKPRALNHALEFCRGEIVGILDAEDRPDPGQLRAVAERLADAPPSVACVQCQLTYYNAGENWLSRCFQLEYSIWFAVLLRGWQALGLPIPLGGTSVYFRRSALEAVGGWDAHNVTEDADLGMRLARRGFTCAVLASETGEEANCRPWPWIRQRSRWLKGYLLTWLGHMRDPLRLWRELGPRGFIGLNVLFLGAATAYLAMPLFWAALAGWALGAGALWQAALPGWALWPALASLALGQAVMLGCAALAMVRRGTPGLLWWVPTLPLYWSLGALAAWKAVAELAVAPFWWDKTRHGTSRAFAAE